MIEDQYIHGLYCAICGKAALSAVHLDKFPDYVACANCSSAFVIEADGDRVMYGTIPVEYPKTSRFALQQWTWLEAVERRAKLERPGDIPSEATSGSLTAGDAIESAEAQHHEEMAEAIESQAELEGTISESDDSGSSDFVLDTDHSSEKTDGVIGSQIESGLDSAHTEFGWPSEQETPDVVEEELIDTPADITDDQDSLPGDPADSDLDLISQMGGPPGLEEIEPSPTGDQEIDPSAGVSVAYEGVLHSEIEMEPSSPSASLGTVSEEQAPPEASSSSDDDVEAEIIDQQLDVDPIPESKDRPGLEPSEAESPAEDVSPMQDEEPEALDAVFSDDWLDGVAKTPPSEEHVRQAPVELFQSEEPEDLRGVPLESREDQVKQDTSQADDEVEAELDPTTWLENNSEPDSEPEAQPSNASEYSREVDQDPIFVEEPEAFSQPDVAAETDGTHDGIPHKEAVVIGGIEVTEDFEDYAGVMPFEEASGIAESVQVDGISTEGKEPLTGVVEGSMDATDQAAAPGLAVAEDREAQAIDHSDPPAGTRHRVVLQRAKANIPFGICAHCLRSPATNELIILDPWISPDADQKERGYTLFLCPTCYKRARAPSDQQRNARITAILVSALVALTVVVFAVIIGLVSFRENPLVDAVILIILAIIGFMIPAMILLNRANQYPPSADAAYVRSTLFIPPRGDETEVIFEWRNKGFAARFAESNYELLLGEVSEIPDQAPGLQDGE
jgi:hypothetical protein